MLWTALDLLYPQRVAGEDTQAVRVRRMAWVLTALVSIMVISGGVVAGIRADSPTTPFPDERPRRAPELFMLEPWYRNVFYNMATVQFNHRLIAWVLVLFVPWLCSKREDSGCRAACTRWSICYRSRRSTDRARHRHAAAFRPGRSCCDASGRRAGRVHLRTHPQPRPEALISLASLRFAFSWSTQQRQWVLGERHADDVEEHGLCGNPCGDPHAARSSRLSAIVPSTI